MSRARRARHAVPPGALLVSFAVVAFFSAAALGCGPSSSSGTADVTATSPGSATTTTPPGFDISINRDTRGAPGPLARESDLTGLRGP